MNTIEAYHPHSKAPLFTQSQLMQDCCEDLLTQTPVQFVWWGRFYRDGSITGITNFPETYKAVFAEKMAIVTPIFNENLIKKNFHYLLPNRGANSVVLKMIEDQFKIGDLIDFFEIHNDYIEIFCMGNPLEYSDSLNFFLNKTDELKKFIPEFKRRAKHALPLVTQHRIQLPEAMIMNSNLLEKFSRNELKLVNNSHALIKKKLKNLTARERECLKLLSKGYTAKNIAQRLYISRKTVEYHTTNIRKKLQLETKYDLIGL